MHVVTWEHEVRAGRDAAFETPHGPAGAPVAPFREHGGRPGTALLRDPEDARRFAIDCWASEGACVASLAAAGALYAEVDARGESPTLDERRIGAWRPC